MPRTRSLAREEEGTAGEMEAAGQGWAGRRVLPREWGPRLRLACALPVLLSPEPASGSSTQTGAPGAADLAGLADPLTSCPPLS